MPDAVLRKAIFLDRDGTVSEDTGYMTDPTIYKVFPWSGQAVRRINESGMLAVLITNQSGVERGYFTEETVRAFHAVLTAELARCSAHLDAIYFCPHRPETGCDCRKPKAGMVRQAALELGIDLAESFIVGDRYLDVETARAAGMRAALVRTGHGAEELEMYRDSLFQPNVVADNLLSAVEAILASYGAGRALDRQ
jgi:D-glycero-D-manno-heptose 1,7-bisphosphate phosphatase